MTQDLGQHQLPAAEHERIFRDEIVPQLLAAARPQPRPLVVFIGGQTGAGKTAVTRMITRALQQRGGYINANMDFYTPHHPAYAGLLAQDETTASAHVRPDTEQWWVKAQQYAISQRYHVVIETALRSPAEFEDLVPAFREGGYTIEVALLAVPEALSRLGVLARYWGEVADSQGKGGRLVEPAVHDECYRGILRAAAAIEEHDLADTVFAFRRNGQAVYANSRDENRQWTRPPACVSAIIAERTRSWDDQERAWFHGAVTDLRHRIDPIWHPEIQQIRALAWPLIGPPLQGITAAAQQPQQEQTPREPSPDTSACGTGPRAEAGPTAKSAPSARDSAATTASVPASVAEPVSRAPHTAAAVARSSGVSPEDEVHLEKRQAASAPPVEAPSPQARARGR